LWARLRKSDGADLINEYIMNKYPLDKDWTILNRGNQQLERDLILWVNNIETFAKCKRDNWDPTEQGQPSQQECNDAKRKEVYNMVAPVV